MGGDLDSIVPVPATTALANVASVGNGAASAVSVDEVKALGVFSLAFHAFEMR